MREKRIIIVMAFAVVFGLIAAALVGRYLSNVEGRSNKIVVARVNIPLSTMITADQLTLQQFPREATPDGVFDAPEKLIGRVSLTNIGAREPLTESKLAAQGSEAGLTAMIAEGFRAITVKVDEVVGVAGLLQPGAWVDVVAVVNPQDRSSGEGPTSKIVLQHIKVLATDQNIEQEKKDNEVSSVKAVTLQVLPEEAEKLALAAAEGKLQLVMRNSVDKNDVLTAGVNKHTLLVGDRVVPSTDPAAGGAATAERSKQGARVTAGPPRRTPPSLSFPSMYERPPQSAPKDPIGRKPAPAPARNSVEVFDGGKRRTIELP